MNQSLQDLIVNSDVGGAVAVLVSGLAISVLSLLFGGSSPSGNQDKT